MSTNGDQIDAIVQKSQLEGERAIAIFRIVVSIALLALIGVTIASNEWRISVDDWTNIAAAGTAVVVGVVALVLSLRGVYRRWFTYLTASADVLLVSIALWTSQYAEHASLASIVSANTFALYFVAIVFTLRRYDRWNTAFSATLATITYLLMMVAIGRAGLYGVVLAGADGAPAVAEINLVNELVKLMSLTLTGYIGFGIVRATRRLFDEGLAAQAEVDRVTSTFGRYVSADLAETLLHTTIEATGEERDATIVFIDIVDFTSATERLTPNALFRGLNIFVSHVISLANEYEGFINKFIGDAVMIVFGAPLVNAAHRERAIDFARALADRRETIARELEAEGIDWEFRYGVGVNSGAVFLGNIGNDERAEYTAIGDAVNVAARLEKATHQQKISRPILIGESSYSDARAAFLREVGTVTLKGKSEPVKVYQVL